MLKSFLCSQELRKKEVVNHVPTCWTRKKDVQKFVYHRISQSKYISSDKFSIVFQNCILRLFFHSMEPQDQSQSQQSDRLSGLARITQSNIAYHIEYWLNRYWSRMFSTNSIFSKWLVDSWQFGCVESWQILTGHLSQQRLDIVFFGGKLMLLTIHPATEGWIQISWI